MNAEWVVVINVTSVHSWHYNNSNSCSDLSWPRLFVYNMDNCHLPSPKLTSTLPCVGGWKTTYILSAFRWWDVTYSVARQWNTIYWRFPQFRPPFRSGISLSPGRRGEGQVRQHLTGSGGKRVNDSGSRSCRSLTSNASKSWSCITNYPSQM
jgi:hypothetical protein